jgi:hypothetical protein
MGGFSDVDFAGHGGGDESDAALAHEGDGAVSLFD